ncbi:MAG: hypothetical protein K2M17_01475, partial [Bacilli bacterium]|nr:hypothetical protein [Bacilli bacterium]
MADDVEFTAKDLEIIRDASPKTSVQLSCGSFYVNSFDGRRYGYEALGKKLTDLFGLMCPPYFLVEVDYFGSTVEVVVSKDLNELGVFLTFYDLSILFLYSEDQSIPLDISLYFIWYVMEEKYPCSVKNRIDVIKMFIFDILFRNDDRHFNNFGLLFKPDGGIDVVAFDHEQTFNCGDNCQKIAAGFEEYCVPMKENLTKFLIQSS